MKLVDLFRYYKRLGHQDAAIEELEVAINEAAPGLLARDQEWYGTWSSAVEPPASALIKLADGSTSLYAQLQTKGAFTPASATEYDLRVLTLEAGV